MDDLISRRQAIDVIDKEQKEIDVSDVSAMYAYSKCKTIIKQLPSVLGTNLAEVGTDLISRQAAIDAIRDMQAFEDDNGQSYLYLDEVMAVFTDEEELPSAQPKRGKWEMGIDERFVECSECGLMTTRNELRGLAVFGKNEPNFCPNCGADMRGERDDSV